MVGVEASDLVHHPMDGEGDPLPAEQIEDLPNWPHPEKSAKFAFYRPVDKKTGKPLAWMRAGSAIDRRSGVYFILDLEGDSIYVGSSTGTSQQGNIRRTIARHYQDWERKDGSYTGVVLPRRDIAICVLLIDNDQEIPESAQMKTKTGKMPAGQFALAPRQIESWYQRLVDEAGRLIGTAYLLSADSPDTPF